MKIYALRVGNTDDAPNEDIKIFLTRKKAVEACKERVERDYRLPWEEIREEYGLDDSDVFEAGRVVIYNEGTVSHWIVDEVKIDESIETLFNAVTKERGRKYPGTLMTFKGKDGSMFFKESGNWYYTVYDKKGNSSDVGPFKTEAQAKKFWNNRIQDKTSDEMYTVTARRNAPREVIRNEADAKGIVRCPVCGEEHGIGNKVDRCVNCGQRLKFD